MLRCPKCRRPMEQLDAVGHYGRRLSLFKCPACAGIWVDDNIVFAVSRDSALRAESDVQWEEIVTRPRKEPAYCPRCGTDLIEQSGGGLPKGLRIDYCTGCRGFWFDKGELMIYKNYLEEKRQKIRKKMEEDQRHRKQLEETLERFRQEIDFWASIGLGI